MKSNKILAALFAVTTILASCQKIEHETFTSFPSYMITADGAGNYISRSDFTYYSSWQTNTQKDYIWSGSDWVLEHDYTFSYEYGTDNLVSVYTVTEKGSVVDKYEYTYDNNKLLAYQKRTQKTDSGQTITENRYKYDLNNGYISAKYTYVPSEDPEKWVEYRRDAYDRNLDGTTSVAVSSLWDGENYVDTERVYYTYYNGYVSSFEVKKPVNGSWLKYQSSEYSYDSHNRVIEVATEIFDIHVTPATSTKKSEFFFYPD